MSKFIFTGSLLVLLASFLNYPTNSPQDDIKMEAQKEVIVFPISEQIKIARIEKHFSQKELSDRVGMTKMSIERIEKGQLVPTQEMLEKFEKELGVELEITSGF